MRLVPDETAVHRALIGSDLRDSGCLRVETKEMMRMTPTPNRALGAEPVRLPAPWAIFPPLGSALPILLGVVVLVGWQFDLEIFTRERFGFSAMNPTTACLFILSGALLALALRSNPSQAVIWIRRIGACLLLAIAAAKVFEVAIGWPTGVDQWLFADKLTETTDALPNRMAPNTAAVFALIALSLLSLDRPVKKFSFSQAFALLAAFGALLAITGYAYGVKSFGGMTSYIPMAVHTAFTCLALSLGLFFARETTPWAHLFATPDAHGVVARRLFPLVIGATIFLGWLRVVGEREGWYEAAFGSALFAVVLCLLFLAVIRWTVWTVGKIDAQRDALHKQLIEGKWEMEESLRQTQMIIDHARELICTLNAKGELLTVNAACEEILLLPSPRLLGRSFIQLHSQDEEPQIQKAFAEARSGMMPEPFNAHCRRADESYVRLNWSIRWSPHFEKMVCVGRLA